MSSVVGPYHPSNEEEVLPELPGSIADPAEDHPSAHEVIPVSKAGEISPLVLGCAVFGYGIYSSTEFVQGEMPLRVIRYALRSGITAFDTSPWYHPSEIVMGRVFEALRPEFPRESYTLITKLGKYGPKVSQHTYDSDSVKASVERSLKRLKTDYLDIVFILIPAHQFSQGPTQVKQLISDLHDVEFLSSHPFPCPGGNHVSSLSALSSPTSDNPFRLRAPYVPLGDGDKQILEGLIALSSLRAQGKVHKIGVAGYPLPVLLRLTYLAKSAGVHIDVVQTYAQQTIINPSLTAGYLAAFEDAGVEEMTNAAPLAMGILTASGGPEWHPARAQRDGIFAACQEAVQLCKERGTSIEEVSLNFGYKEVKMRKGTVLPVVIGCKSIEEIKRTIKQWREVNVLGVRSAEEAERLGKVEEEVIKLFEERGVKGVSWSSPGQGAL